MKPLLCPEYSIRRRIIMADKSTFVGDALKGFFESGCCSGVDPEYRNLIVYQPFPVAVFQRDLGFANATETT